MINIEECEFLEYHCKCCDNVMVFKNLSYRPSLNCDDIYYRVAPRAMDGTCPECTVDRIKCVQRKYNKIM